MPRLQLLLEPPQHRGPTRLVGGKQRWIHGLAVRLEEGGPHLGLPGAAVIGGRDRWAKRLSGLKNSLERNLADIEDEAKAAMLQRELADLSALSAFALPLLDALAALPSAATWAEWLDPLTALATVLVMTLLRPKNKEA